MINPSIHLFRCGLFKCNFLIFSAFEKTIPFKRKRVVLVGSKFVPDATVLQENCISTILTKVDIVKYRKQFCDLSEEGQRSFIVNFFLTNQCFLNGRKKYIFRVNCKKECQAAWMKAYSISPQPK